MSDLVPAHGGIDAPRTHFIPKHRYEGAMSRASSLKKVALSDADVSTVQRLGDGALSPLDGPMDAETYHRVLEEAVIEREGRCSSWSRFPTTMMRPQIISG